MDATIITGLISAGAAIIVCLINNHFTRKQTESIILYRIGQLEKSVSRHNNLIDRVYKVEQDVALHGERLSNLEKGA